MADTVRHCKPHVRGRNTLPLPRAVAAPPNHTDLVSGTCLPETAANMSALQADLPERKPRKSVAFSEGATIVDSDGQVTESKEMNGGKSTAEHHSGDASPPTGQHAYTRREEQGLTSGVADEPDKEVEEVTDMFADLAKKVRTQTPKATRTRANSRAEEEEVVQEEGGWRRRRRRRRLRRAQEKEEVEQEEG
jgi:translation initiation factor 2 subunit 2